MLHIDFLLISIKVNIGYFLKFLYLITIKCLLIFYQYTDAWNISILYLNNNFKVHFIEDLIVSNLVALKIYYY